jgi:hypothetical protein
MCEDTLEALYDDCDICNALIRASTLARQQSHRSSHAMTCKIFDDVEERKRGRFFAKQPPHERNNHLKSQLHNHYMSCCCHATRNISFFSCTN